MPFEFTFQINHDRFFRALLHEHRCTATCRTGERCKRHVILGYELCHTHMANQRGLRIGQSAHGLGLFATQGEQLSKEERRVFTPDRPVFNKGQRISEYVGEHLTKEQIEYRYDNYTAPYAIQCGPNEYVDSALVRCYASLANTADKKRCNTRFVISGDRVYLEATRKIFPGQEILVDYGPEFILNEYNVKFSTKKVGKRQDDDA